MRRQRVRGSHVWVTSSIEPLENGNEAPVKSRERCWPALGEGGKAAQNSDKNLLFRAPVHRCAHSGCKFCVFGILRVSALGGAKSRLIKSPSNSLVPRTPLEFPPVRGVFRSGHRAWGKGPQPPPSALLCYDTLGSCFLAGSNRLPDA